MSERNIELTVTPPNLSNQSEIKKVEPDLEEGDKGMDIDFDSLLAELECLSNEERETDLEMNNKIIEIFNKFADNASNEESDLENKSIFVANKVGELVTSMMERIKIETGDLGAFKVLPKASLLLVKEKDIIDRMPFFKKDSPVTRGDKINLSEEFSFDPVNLLSGLASEGYDGHTHVMHHKYIHTLQNKDNKEESTHAIQDLLRGYVKVLGMSIFSKWRGITTEDKKAVMDEHMAGALDKIIKSETQAYIGSMRYAERLSASELFDHISENYLLKIKKGNITDRYLETSIGVNRLYALGLEDDEIANILNETEWDIENKNWTVVENKINELMEEQDLEEEDVDNMVLANNLKRKIYLLKIQKIAQEEINNVHAEIVG